MSTQLKVTFITFVIGAIVGMVWMRIAMAMDGYHK